MKEKKKGRGLKITAIVLAVIVALVAACAVANMICNKINNNNIKKFPAVQKEEVLVPVKDENGYWTFTTDRDFKVLQITDVHIGAGWKSMDEDLKAMNAVAAMVTAEKPDLVIVTGDMSMPVPPFSATLNNKSSAKMFANLMEQLGVYWTVVFGNHDTEAYTYFSREEIADVYENGGYEHCLFEKGPDKVDGYGNHIINVKNSQGIITQSLYMLDSHAYVDGDIFGLMWKYDNIHENQVEWYKENVLKINEINAKKMKELGLHGNADVKSAAFFHIPLTEQQDAWYEYMENGFKDTANVQRIYGKAGELGRIVMCGEGEDSFFETVQELGSTKAIFVGHDHDNNFSIDYKGIRLTCGMSIDYLAYIGIEKRGSQRGCTVITFDPQGNFDCHAENYYQDKYVTTFPKEVVEMQEIVEQSTYKAR